MSSSRSVWWTCPESNRSLAGASRALFQLSYRPKVGGWQGFEPSVSVSIRNLCPAFQPVVSTRELFAVWYAMLTSRPAARLPLAGLETCCRTFG